MSETETTAPKAVYKPFQRQETIDENAEFLLQTEDLLDSSLENIKTVCNKKETEFTLQRLRSLKTELTEVRDYLVAPECVNLPVMAKHLILFSVLH